MQILRAGTSAGANYEEADDGELKECRWRMRLVRAAGILTPAQDPVIRESDELVKIVATVIRNAVQRQLDRMAERR